MAFYGLLLSAALLLWAALGFDGLGMRVTSLAKIGFALILLAAGSFALAEGLGH